MKFEDFCSPERGKAGILLSLLLSFTHQRRIPAMGKGIVLGGAALQGFSPEERPGGHQVWSHLQVGT